MPSAEASVFCPDLGCCGKGVASACPLERAMHCMPEADDKNPRQIVHSLMVRLLCEEGSVQTRITDWGNLGILYKETGGKGGVAPIVIEAIESFAIRRKLARKDGKTSEDVMVDAVVSIFKMLNAGRMVKYQDPWVRLKRHQYVHLGGRKKDFGVMFYSLKV